MGGTGDRRARMGALAGVVALALAGCASLGGGTTSSGTDPGGTGDGGGRAVDDRGGGTTGAPLLQVRTAGGFVPVGYDFRTVPELTLYPDGTVITHGPRVLIYPGLALPNLLTTRLDPADLDAVVDAARDAGLLADAPDYGRPEVTDVATTTVTLRVDGDEHVHAAYALSLGDPGATADLPADAAAARATLTAFLDQVRDLVGHGLDGEQYAAERFGVLAEPVPDDALRLEDGMERQVLPWPVRTVALADAGGCVLVDGDDGVTLAGVLAEANQLTVFEQDGARYEVHPRPLLPHETGCVDL